MGGIGSGRKSKATATCPRPGRVGSGVKFDGTYGPSGHRRRRYRCEPTGDPRLSTHGQLVADWVEVFAPVVFEPHRPNDWPSEGTLVLDHLPFRVKTLNARGQAIPCGRVAFDVFAAMGYHRNEPRSWRLEDVPQRQRHALERLRAAQARRGYGTAAAAGVPALGAWRDTNDPIIRGQFSRRGFAGTRPKNMPLTIGGLEQRLRPIRDTIHPRRYAFKNRERTNRLLMLVQLHANGDDSEAAYRKAILDWLLANGGLPRGPRCSIADPLGSPFLR